MYHSSAKKCLLLFLFIWHEFICITAIWLKIKLLVPLWFIITCHFSYRSRVLIILLTAIVYFVAGRRNWTEKILLMLCAINEIAFLWSRKSKGEASKAARVGFSVIFALVWEGKTFENLPKAPLKTLNTQTVTNNRSTKTHRHANCDTYEHNCLSSTLVVIEIH